MENDKKQFNINIPRRSRDRYGADELSTFLVGVGIALGAFAYMSNYSSLGTLGVAFLIYALFRMTSTKISARRKENRRYLAFKQKLTGGFTKNSKNTKQTSKSASQSDKKEIACPKCSAHMNVPVGKGSIRVTCPSCNEKFTIES